MTLSHDGRGRQASSNLLQKACLERALSSALMVSADATIYAVTGQSYFAQCFDGRHSRSARKAPYTSGWPPAAIEGFCVRLIAARGRLGQSYRDYYRILEAMISGGSGRRHHRAHFQLY